jgi:transcriptional regulator with XRE-family HTH domain
MDIKSRLRELLEEIIKSNNLSNVKMGSLFGVDKNTIDSYRNKRSVPNIEFMGEFCKKFSVNPSWLLFGQGGKYILDEYNSASKPNNVVGLHQDVVTRFNNKELAKDINEDLLDIERLSPPVFDDTGKKIKIIADTLRTAAKGKPGESKPVATEKKNAG